MLRHLARLFRAHRQRGSSLPGLSSVCIPGVPGLPAPCWVASVRCPPDGFRTPCPRLPSPFSNGEGKTLRYRVQAVPGDAGCVASPAEGWCLCCFTTSWLCSAKSGVWMKSKGKKKKKPTSLAFCRGRECCRSPMGAAAGQGGESCVLSPPELSHPGGCQPAPRNPAAASLGCCGRLHKHSGSSLPPRDGDGWDFYLFFSRPEELGRRCDRGAASGEFSLALVNAQDMTPIFSFCLSFAFSGKRAKGRKPINPRQQI